MEQETLKVGLALKEGQLDRKNLILIARYDGGSVMFWTVFPPKAVRTFLGYMAS